MSYESPINVIYRDIAEQVTQQSENAIMQAVNMYVQVDKAELVRALEYDRGQYKKGYADAKRDYERPRGEWILISERLPDRFGDVVDAVTRTI